MLADRDPGRIGQLAAAVLDRQLVEEGVAEWIEIGDPAAQRRQHDEQRRQPVVEVDAHAALLGAERMQAVGRGQDPDVDGALGAGAEAADLPGLERAQQVRLQQQR